MFSTDPRKTPRQFRHWFSAFKKKTHSTQNFDKSPRLWLQLLGKLYLKRQVGGWGTKRLKTIRVHTRSLQGLRKPQRWEVDGENDVLLFKFGWIFEVPAVNWIGGELSIQIGAKNSKGAICLKPPASTFFFLSREGSWVANSGELTLSGAGMAKHQPTRPTK